MSTSIWLYVLLTLSAAFGISYFLRLTPGLGFPKLSLSISSPITSRYSQTYNGAHPPPTQDTEVDTDTEGEVDNRLPPLQNQCLSCGKTAKELGNLMLRCSQCKNAFYCNNKCQKQEWKRHKFNCSLFPPEGLKPARILITREFIDEVMRVDETLKTWLDRVSELTNGLKENVEKINAADLPEAIPICQLRLSPEFQYKNLPQQQLERHPFRNPILQICRLYLITLVASHPDPENRKALAESFSSIQLPSHLAPLYGPKIMSRPGDLSPGEYDTLAEVAPMIMAKPEKVGIDENERGRWIALAVAVKKLWNAGLVPKLSTITPPTQ